jgi:hypothetical protein
MKYIENNEKYKRNLHIKNECLPEQIVTLYDRL